MLLSRCCILTKLEQFLARISDHKLSGLSKHDLHKNHVEFKGPNRYDPVILIDIWKDSGLACESTGFL